MPIIPQYNAPFPNISVSDRGVEAWQRAGRVVGELGREAARYTEQGFKEAASNIDQFAQKYQQQQDFNDHIQGIRSLAQIKADEVTGLNDLVKNTGPDDLPNALVQYQRQQADTLDQWVSGFSSSSKKIQLWATEQAESHKLESLKRYNAESAVNAGNKAVADIGHTANAIASTLSNNPSTLEIDSALKTWDQLIQAQMSNPALTNPEGRAKVQKDLEAQRGQWVETGIYRAIDANPNVADSLVKRYGGYLTPQQQRSILEHSVGTTNKQFWQNRAEEQDARRIEKDAAGRALTDLTTSTFAMGPDNKPTGERFIPPNYFGKAVDIGNMPGADHAMIKAAIEDAQQILNRQKNGVIATTDPTTYQQLFGKAYNGLSDQDIFTAHANGKLSDHDSTMFHQAVSDAVRNPAMTQNKQQFDRFINTYAKPFITKSDMMNPDPVEFQRLQQFENDKWLQYQQGLSKGMSAYDLLDQRSQNFIGKDVTNYQLSPDQRLKGITDRATTGQQPIPPVQAQPRMPAESAQDYLRRTQSGTKQEKPTPANPAPANPAAQQPIPPGTPQGVTAPPGPKIDLPTFGPTAPPIPPGAQ